MIWILVERDELHLLAKGTQLELVNTLRAHDVLRKLPISHLYLLCIFFHVTAEDY